MDLYREIMKKTYWFMQLLTEMLNENKRLSVNTIRMILITNKRKQL
jgi:hypothetical protein